MVGKTVNHDAPQMYHLFYGDRKGTPGSRITYFPEMIDEEEEPGAGLGARESRPTSWENIGTYLYRKNRDPRILPGSLPYCRIRCTEFW